MSFTFCFAVKLNEISILLLKIKIKIVIREEYQIKNTRPIVPIHQISLALISFSTFPTPTPLVSRRSLKPIVSTVYSPTLFPFISVCPSPTAVICKIPFLMCDYQIWVIIWCLKLFCALKIGFMILANHRKHLSVSFRLRLHFIYRLDAFDFVLGWLQ